MKTLQDTISHTYKEKTLELALGKEKAYLPRAYGPWEGKLFFPWANLMVFYNPCDEEISIRKSLICELNTADL